MRALRSLCGLHAALSLAPAHRVQCREWSLEALMRQPTDIDALLAEVRSHAAASAEWDIDVNTLVAHGTAVGCTSPRLQSELMGRVAAALAHVLHTSPTASSAAAVGSVRSLRWTLASPASVDTLVQLVQTTALLRHVKAVELVVEPGAGGVGQDAMEGGQAVAQLLRVLAGASAHLPAWRRLTVVAREAAVTTASGSPAEMSLFTSHGSARGLWADATVAALTALVLSKKWTSLSFLHVDCVACSPRVRQQLWQACAQSGSTLSQLHLTGTQPARECIGSGLLRLLPALTLLDVSHTMLDAAAVVRLLSDVHEATGGWWRLRHLGLAQCEVDESVVDAMAAHLREDRRAHQRTEGEDAEGEETRLHLLDISGAQLNRTSVFALAGCLLPCVHLTHLHTRHCRLQAGDVEHLAASLQNATGLQTWTLCRNRIGDEGVAALAKYGKYWPALRELDLTRCRLTCVAVRALSRALPAWDQLEVLRLSGNDLRCPAATADTAEHSSDEATGLFAYDPTYMKAHGSSAKVPTAFELDRRDRAEGRRRYRGTEAFVAAAAAVAAQAQRRLAPLEELGEALALCRRLRVLDLSDAALTDEGLQQLTQTFSDGAGGGGLVEVVLASNPLFATVAGLDALPRLLEHATALTSLDLSFTGLGDLGVSMLCDGTSGTSPGLLTCMPHLQTLLLAGCGVHTLGWESLAAVLPSLPALRHLTLHHNCAEESGLVEELLAQLAAAPLRELRSAQLMGCVADQAAAQRMAEGEACATLRRRCVQVCV